MATEVIILAQGTQRRLGMSVGHKQLLPLPACGNTPIIERTLRQVVQIEFAIRAAATALVVSHYGLSDTITTVVTWEAVRAALSPRAGLRFVELADPGNSSLKGIARYLEQRSTVGVDRTIVLLGDCVYSWSCLEKIWKIAGANGFVGTSDLSESAGELWGVGWHKEHDDAMMLDLRDAILRHPPFEDEYQPGQLRRWILGMRRGSIRQHVGHMSYEGSYVSVSDYTRDIDHPEHLRLIPALSESARVDDASYGVEW